MPDLVTHYYFGEQVLASLPEHLNQAIQKDIFFHTTPGPDVWFPMGFYGGKNKAKCKRGGYMHKNHTGAFLTALAREAQSQEDKDALFSYLTGFLCHYALDTVAHPYILYSTGEYNDSPDTISYRGNHTRLERAIDCWIIRSKYGLIPGRFSITNRMLALKRLPDSLREPLNRVYGEVYGWENAWEDLNTATADHRFFYRVMRDPVHLVNFFTGLFDNGTSHLDYRLLSYRNRDLDPETIDFLNLRHRQWRHPYDPARTSTASFPELMELARQKALQLIDIIYDYVYHKEEYDLPSLIGNESYSTGLDCLDPRNHHPSIFDPLF